MTDIIKLLPDNIANQIAAGEVVQRPASVVKELLENSVDAGSRSIRLFLKNAGKTLVQVVDDGCGMSETDARMCFERHATSKIRELGDLYQIHTLGFRGEAMASIAAVAQVEMRTKRRIDDVGVVVMVENSEVVQHEACACPDGTSISVKNLFFNVPARKNFLKSNQVELRHITDEFLRVALAHPEIHFSMFNENEEVYHLRAGNLKQRIVSIWGKKYEEALVPVEEETDILRISGYIGKPDFARKTRGEQFFFANNRFIRSAYLNHAVIGGYEGLLGEDAFPFYTIFLELAPARIDINVHPTKTEIKFEDEKAIYLMLRTAIRKALSQYHVAPSLNFDDEASMPLPPMPGTGSTSQAPREHISTGLSPNWQPSTYSGSGSGAGSSRPMQQKAKPEEWEELYKVLSMATPDENESETEQEELIEVADTAQKPVMQLHQKYIVTSIRSGLVIVHQGLAHERILFEKYLNALEESHIFSQRMLFPEVIQLSHSDFNLVRELMPDIRALGFELEEFGKNAFLVNGIPVDLQMHDLKILEKIIEEYKNTQVLEKQGSHERLAAALARHAAIKQGKTLNPEEMTQLIDELFACRMPYYSPDGKPVIITVSSQELDKKFKK